MSKGAKCPNCKKRGGVISRVDAFAIFKHFEDGTTKLIDTEIFDDIDGFHCTKCDTEIDEYDLD